MLDNHVADWLLADEERLQAVKDAVQSGRIRVLEPTVIIEETMATPNDRPGDEQKRDRLAQVLHTIGAERVRNAIDSWGNGRWGHMEWSSEEQAQMALRMDTPSRNHRRDAVLAVTAKRQSAVLVTDDSRLSRVAAENGISVCDTDAFIKKIVGGSEDPPSSNELSAGATGTRKNRPHEEHQGQSNDG